MKKTVAKIYPLWYKKILQMMKSNKGRKPLPWLENSWAQKTLDPNSNLEPTLFLISSYPNPFFKLPKLVFEDFLCLFKDYPLVTPCYKIVRVSSCSRCPKPGPFDYNDKTRVRLRPCSILSKQKHVPVHFFFENSVFVFVYVRVITNEQTCSVLTCTISFIPARGHKKTILHWIYWCMY